MTTDATMTAALGELFPVRMRSGLYLVAYTNGDGCATAQHGNGICLAAARAMAAELTEHGSSSGDFDLIAQSFELRARPTECLRDALPSESLAAVVESLENARPWTWCHRPPCELDDEPF